MELNGHTNWGTKVRNIHYFYKLFLFLYSIKSPPPMETTFTYDRFVTGKAFVGRKAEREELCKALSEGVNVSIYEGPKIGKTSLIRQCLQDLMVKGSKIKTIELDLLPIRNLSAFLSTYVRNSLSIAAHTDREYDEYKSRYLPGIDLGANSFDDDTIAKVLSLPIELARDLGTKIAVINFEFQNAGKFEDSYRLLRIHERIASNKPQEVNWIWVGSQVNGMKEIFEKDKFFYRCSRHIALQTIPYKEIESYINKGFLLNGKVIEKEQISRIYSALQGNICYINHFAAICDGLSRGYITDAVMEESLISLLSIHRPRFTSMVYDLTGFQINLLKAILDGHTRFSSATTIEQYALNSSANVKRLKEALCKKEIITFTPAGEPVIQDPLFEYWLRNYYFVF